jgi:hypothetical protein
LLAQAGVNKGVWFFRSVCTLLSCDSWGQLHSFLVN